MARETRRKCQLRPETLERRLCMAASLGWDGPGQGDASLTNYVGSVPPSVDLVQTELEVALESALDVWAEVADVTFTETQLSNQPDSIEFEFRSMDGPGGTLAQAYFPDDVNPPRIAGDIQFDVAELWEVENRLGSAAFDLVLVAVHEVGHALPRAFNRPGRFGHHRNPTSRVFTVNVLPSSHDEDRTSGPDTEQFRTRLDSIFGRLLRHCLRAERGSRLVRDSIFSRWNRVRT